MINACPEPLKSIVIIALNTGMRRGEILGLKWQDIDFKEKNCMLWDTKNKEKRIVPLNSQCMIYSWNKKNPDSEYVFSGESPKGHVGETYMTHMFKEMVKKLGIQDFRFHDLRHTFASWLVMKGINLKTVQELLGHKDFMMTLRYAHLSHDHKKQAVEFLVENMSGRKTMDTIWTPEGKLETQKTPQVIENS